MACCTVCAPYFDWPLHATDEPMTPASGIGASLLGHLRGVATDSSEVPHRPPLSPRV